MHCHKKLRKDHAYIDRIKQLYAEQSGQMATSHSKIILYGSSKVDLSSKQATESIAF
jgi:hypothetical protein